MASAGLEARITASLLHFERLLARVPPTHYLAQPSQEDASLNKAFFKVRAGARDAFW